MAIMPADRILAPEVAAEAGEKEFLTVNMVMPAMGDTAKETASFARLLFGLTALALERFGAAQENHSPDALRGLVPPCPADAPVDPFDGQLLCFCQADTGCQRSGICPTLAGVPSGKDDLAHSCALGRCCSSVASSEGV